MGGKKKDVSNNKLDSRSLEKRFSTLKDSSEEIQSVSKWCLQHKSQYHAIVQAWARALRKSKVSHRLTLFYVCNDIVQNARRKKALSIVQHFFTAIKDVTPLVRDEKISNKITRVFTIWEERGIYDSKLISELKETIKNVGKANTSENEIVVSTFQPVQLLESIRSLLALESTADSLLGDLQSQDFNLTDQELDALSLSIKDRSPSVEKITEFEEAMTSLECYSTTLQKQIDERTRVISLLEQGEIFYESQRGEAKLVANAYKSFGTRLKTVKSKLTEKLKNYSSSDSPLIEEPPSPSEVPSPIPSPLLGSPAPSEDTTKEENNGSFDSFVPSHTTDLDSRLASLASMGSATMPKLNNTISSVSSQDESSYVAPLDTTDKNADLLKDSQLNTSAVFDEAPKATVDDEKRIRKSRSKSRDCEITVLEDHSSKSSRSGKEYKEYKKEYKNYYHHHSSEGFSSKDYKEYSSSYSSSRDYHKEYSESKSKSRDYSSSSRDYPLPPLSSLEYLKSKDSLKEEYQKLKEEYQKSKEKSKEEYKSKDDYHKKEDYHKSKSDYHRSYSSGRESSASDSKSERRESRESYYKESDAMESERSTSRNEQTAKDYKPMSAKELLDAFSKELVAKSVPVSSESAPSLDSPSKSFPSFIPLPVPPPPCPAPPSFSAPPSSSLSLPPSATLAGLPANIPPSGYLHTPVPLPPGRPISTNPPLPPPPRSENSTSQPPFSFSPSKNWNYAPPLPSCPPPPPPPQISPGGGGAPMFWSEHNYQDYSNDNINWMEPPGNDEIAALSAQDNNGASDKNIKEIVTHSDFKCYNYKSLEKETRKANSDSDMDISGSDDEGENTKRGNKRRATDSAGDKSPAKKGKLSEDLGEESDDSFASTLSMESDVNPIKSVKDAAPIQTLVGNNGGTNTSIPPPSKDSYSNLVTASNYQPQYDEFPNDHDSLYADLGEDSYAAPHSNTQEPFSKINIGAGDFSNISNAIKILISGERRKSEAPDANSKAGVEENDWDSVYKNDSEGNSLSVIDRLGSPVHKQGSNSLNTGTSLLGSPPVDIPKSLPIRGQPPFPPKNVDDFSSPHRFENNPYRMPGESSLRGRGSPSIRGMRTPMPSGGRGMSPGDRGRFSGGRGMGPGVRGMPPGGRGMSPGGRGMSPGGRGMSPGNQGISPGGRGMIPPIHGFRPRGPPMSFRGPPFRGNRNSFGSSPHGRW